MNFNCPVCSQPLEADSGLSGKNTQCSSCGRFVPVPRAQPAPAAAAPSLPAPATRSIEIGRPAATRAQPTPVVITDIKVTIPAMTVFMLKWFVATIPVMLIVGAIYAVIFLSVLGGCAALMMGAKR